jgi:hypothetical protein
MAGKQSNLYQSFRSRICPVVIIRVSSILVVLLMVGHMSAYPWTSTHGLQDRELVASMKSIDFVFLGERSTYWSLYYGWGVLVGVLLLSLAIVLWLLSDLSRLAPRRVGAITGALATTCFVGTYISFYYFYLPPTIMFAVISFLLLTTTMQLCGRGRALRGDAMLDSTRAHSRQTIDDLDLLQDFNDNPVKTKLRS